MSNSSSSSMTNSTMSSESAPMSSMNVVVRLIFSLSYAKWSQTMSITRCSTDTVRPSGRWRGHRESRGRAGSNRPRGTCGMSVARPTRVRGLGGLTLGAVPTTLRQNLLTRAEKERPTRPIRSNRNSQDADSQRQSDPDSPSGIANPHDSGRHVPDVGLPVAPASAARPARGPGRSRRTARRPSASRPRIVSSHRTGESTCRTSKLADFRRVGVRLRVHVRPDRHDRRRRLSTPASASASRSSAGFIRSVWNAPATASRTVRMPPFSHARVCSTRSIAASAPGDDRVAGAEVVGDLRACRRRGPPTTSASTSGTSSPSTLTMPDGRRLGRGLHRPPAGLHDLQPVVERHRPGEDERRVLAEAQPGGRDHAGERVRFGRLELFERGEAGDEDRRLADVGGVEPLGRAVDADVEQVVAEDRRRPGRRGPSRRAATGTASPAMPTVWAP